MIVSYDIDGVLAEGPPPSDKKWGRMNKYERADRKRFLVKWYRNAAPLLVPKEPYFIAVSARKYEGEVYAATKLWLDHYYPNRVVDIFLLEKSRSVINAANFKAEVMIRENVLIHYEDNKPVLNIMKKLAPNVMYYFWKKGMQEPIEY
jgi:hypothetical protein